MCDICYNDEDDGVLDKCTQCTCVVHRVCLERAFAAGVRRKCPQCCVEWRLPVPTFAEWDADIPGQMIGSSRPLLPWIQVCGTARDAQRILGVWADNVDTVVVFTNVVDSELPVWCGNCAACLKGSQTLHTCTIPVGAVRDGWDPVGVSVMIERLASKHRDKSVLFIVDDNDTLKSYDSVVAIRKMQMYRHTLNIGFCFVNRNIGALTPSERRCLNAIIVCDSRVGFAVLENEYSMRNLRGVMNERVAAGSGLVFTNSPGNKVFTWKISNLLQPPTLGCDEWRKYMIENQETYSSRDRVRLPSVMRVRKGAVGAKLRIF